MADCDGCNEEQWKQLKERQAKRQAEIFNKLPVLTPEERQRIGKGYEFFIAYKEELDYFLKAQRDDTERNMIKQIVEWLDKDIREKGNLWEVPLGIMIFLTDEEWQALQKAGEKQNLEKNAE